VGRVRKKPRRGTYQCVENLNNLGPRSVNVGRINYKRRRGARGDSHSRRRQPRRFAHLDLNSFAPVLRPVSAPPARGAACLNFPREQARTRMWRPGKQCYI